MSISASITFRSFRPWFRFRNQERGLKHTRFLSFLDDQNQLGGDDLSGKRKTESAASPHSVSLAPVKLHVLTDVASCVRYSRRAAATLLSPPPSRAGNSRWIRKKTRYETFALS